MNGAWPVAVLDFIGTLAFAISGAMVGARRGVDLFGMLVLAFVTAVAGGIMRDLALGAVPPAALASWHLLAVAIFGGLLAFLVPSLITRLRLSMLLFDAVGLAVFAVTGAQQALDHGMTPLMAAILGMLTGIGGGIVRDVLTTQVPIVLRADIYAVAALAGALVVAGGHMLGIGAGVASVAGAGLCLFLRLMAINRGWALPLARPPTKD